MIISTGKDASNDNLENHFHLFGIVLMQSKKMVGYFVAECKGGLGSDAIQQYIEKN